MDMFGLFLWGFEMLLDYKTNQHVKDTVAAVSSLYSLLKK